MGISGLESINQLFSQSSLFKTNNKGGRPHKAKHHLPKHSLFKKPHKLKHGDRANGRHKSENNLTGSGGDIQSQFEALIYSSKVEHTSLAVRFSEAARRVAQANGENSQVETASAQQMTFDFFAETRIEELAMFRERTATTADGLEGIQQQTFIQRSREVAARFEMSISVSGVALNGFAGAAEGLQGSEGGMMDELLGFTGELLGKADEIINEVFDLINGFFSSEGDYNFEEKFNELMDKLFNLDLGQFGTPGEIPESLNGGQVTQSSMQLEFNFEFRMSISVKESTVQESDPITLDLDGDGIELSSYRNGAKFDIVGNGQISTTAFVNGGDAFLVFDRNNNGIVDNGRELFGDQNGAANGFEELRKFDSNGDNLINNLDADFAKLLLFKDNGNGKTEAGELISLLEAGIAEISLRYKNVDTRTSGGNRIGQIASYRNVDGTQGTTVDSILNYIS